MTAAVRTRVTPFPKTLWVSGYEFPLAIVEGEDVRLEGADGLTETGEKSRAIWIAAHLGTYRTVEIVLHEITHAINWAYDLCNAEDMADEEDIATKHGAAWARLYLDNPKFCQWLNSAINRVRAERANA